MKIVLWFLMGLVCLCLEVFLSMTFGSTPWIPPFWPLFVLWLATHPPKIGALSCILVTGIVGDVLSAAPMGTVPAGGLLLYLVAIQLTGRIQVKTFVGRSTLGALGGVFTVLISALVIRMGAHQDIGPRLAELFVPSLTMMALSAPLLLPLFTLIEGLVSPRIEIDRI